MHFNNIIFFVEPTLNNVFDNNNISNINNNIINNNINNNNNNKKDNYWHLSNIF